jgi:hypothetical protein
MSQAPVTTACILIPVGPGPHYIRGFVDLLESLAVYEPNKSRVIAVSDGHADDIRRAAQTVQIPVDVVTNPRGGRGNGLFGGGCCGTIAGLAEAARGGDTVIIKIDTDALFIDRCFDRLDELFSDNGNAGLAGRLMPARQELARAVNRLRWPVAVWRQPRPGHRRVVPLLSGPSRRAASLIRQAIDAGWEAGSHCQGGAYALSPQFVKSLAEHGILDRPLDWLELPIGEDMMITALAFALGFEVVDASGPDALFALDWRQLPAGAHDLLNSANAVVHSLKSDPDGRSEDELRHIFRAVRGTG